MGSSDLYTHLNSPPLQPSTVHQLAETKTIVEQKGLKKQKQLCKIGKIDLLYLGLYARKWDFVVCKQQRRRPACAFAQSDQHLFIHSM